MPVTPPVPTSASPAPAPISPPPPLNKAILPKRHHRLRWTLLSIAGVTIVILAVAGWIVYRAISVVNTKPLDGSNRKLSFFQQLTHLVTQKETPLQGETDDRINILLLGIGGPGHDGPYLTDTIMLLSVKPSTHEVSMLSIPRDLVVNIPGYDYRKINNVLSFGRDQKYPGGGDALMVKVTSELVDLPIQYYARIDFKGFEQVIDTLGGVDVTIDHAFADYEYPDNNYGYQTVKFKAGPQEMDGATALEFARSRHGNNGEGSDFARAARQQKIILATKEKALSLGTLLNPKKISDILGAIGSHSQTNMEVWEMIRLANLAKDTSSDKIVNKVLDNNTNGLLTAATGQGGAYILVPKGNNYDDIQFLANNIFLIGAAEREQATVMVANATTAAGLGDTTSRNLAAFGLRLAKPITLRDITLDQTLILDRSNGQFPATTQLLRRYKRAQGSVTLAQWAAQTDDTSLAEKLTALDQAGAANINATVNGNTNSAVTKPVDVVIILGQDQPKIKAATIPAFPPRT